MMGVGHATLGVATWCVAAPLVVEATGNEITAGTLLMGAIPVAGAALIPDIDHPNGSIANSGGPITRAIARCASFFSGGHREGTHTLPFFALVAAAAFLTVWAGNMWAAIGWYFVLAAFGAQALAKTALHQKFNRQWKKRTGLFAKAYCWAFALAATVGAITVYGRDDAQAWWWLPFAVLIGHATHLVGDIMTTAGLDLGLGLPKVRFPILGDAGSSREHLLTALLSVVAAFFMLCAVLGVNPYENLGEFGQALTNLFESPTGSSGFVVK